MAETASHPPAPRRALLGLAGWALLCVLAAGLGGAVTRPEIGDWYATLAKPSFNPPGWVFGPAWTILFAMMAVAVWLVWRKAGWGGARGALTLFLVQLVLNVLWSVLFFGMQSPGAAFVEVFALWAAILATIVAFHRHSPLAAWLLVPYIAWVSFAAVLNGWIWMNN